MTGVESSPVTGQVHSDAESKFCPEKGQDLPLCTINIANIDKKK